MSEPLNTRQKRLRFRAWHRGTREADLIFGQFIDLHIMALTGPEIAWFEALFDEPEQDVLAWATGKIPPPDQYNTELMKNIRKLDYLVVKK